MGISSSKSQRIEPTNININIDLGGLKKFYNSANPVNCINSIHSVNNGSTGLESSSFRILDGEPPPMPFPEGKNSYSDQTYNINIQPNNGNISIPINKIINNNSIQPSPNPNNDNNIKDAYLNKKSENNTNNENDINPNVKIDENLYQKKETSKGSKGKKEINPNIGNFDGGKEEEVFTKPPIRDNNVGNNFNPDNYKFFTNPGDNVDNNTEKGQQNYKSPNPDGNKDNNTIHDSISHPLDDDNNKEEENKNKDKDLSESVLLASFQNLNFMDPKDRSIIKNMATQKYNEGYFPLFVKMDHGFKFYYLNQESSLKSLLVSHLKSLNIPYCEENYSCYNKGNKLNTNIPVGEIENLPILSIIEIKKI